MHPSVCFKKKKKETQILKLYPRPGASQVA